MFDEYLGLRTY